MGLLGSVAINRFPRWIPSVVRETETTVAIRHPRPKKRVHYVVIPKKDITSVGDLRNEDQPYLIDAFGIIRELIGRERLTNYEVLTNGPGRQTVTYLHFHLMSD
jgi:diadenosine tetraphosphate (Ap4A) HIT family hydrolase